MFLCVCLCHQVSDHALHLASEGDMSVGREKEREGRYGITESGLEGRLFALCDTETDGKLTSDIQDTLVSLLQTLATHDLTRWLNLLREILSSSGEASCIDFYCIALHHQLSV